MHLGALSAGSADTVNASSIGQTYGTTPTGDTLVCPPGQPWDAAMQDCSGAPCLPMIQNLDGSYSLPSGPLAPGQSVCPPPPSITPALFTTGPTAKTIITGVPDWVVYAGVGALILTLAMGGRR